MKKLACRIVGHRHKVMVGHVWSGDAVYWCPRCKKRVV
jgi:hypothetical protein